MAGPSEAPDPRMNAQDLYREESFSDRKVGSIRVMTPVKSDGTADPSRKVIYIGQAQIMTPAGVLPLSFELDARDLADACEKFADGARQGLEDTMRELQEMRRESASSIVIPEAGAASALGQGMPSPGKIKIP
jgi:hypothetical protein